MGRRETVSAVFDRVTEETSFTDEGKHDVILILQAEQSCDVIVKSVCFKQFVPILICYCGVILVWIHFNLACWQDMFPQCLAMCQVGTFILR